MKDYLCLYSVDALDINDEEQTYYGILFADNFTDAVKQLEEVLYGSDLTKINEIELYDAIPQFSHEVYRMMQDELNKP